MCELVEPDTKHELGASTRPSPLAFDLLQALEPSADIEDHPSALSGKCSVNFGQGRARMLKRKSRVPPRHSDYG